MLGIGLARSEEWLLKRKLLGLCWKASITTTVEFASLESSLSFKLRKELGSLKLRWQQGIIFLFSVYERAASGCEGGTDAHFCRHFPRPARCEQLATVEAAFVRSRVPAHRRARTPQVRPSRLEYSLRIQYFRSLRHSAVRAKPPRWFGPETRHPVEYCTIHDR